MSITALCLFPTKWTWIIAVCLLAALAMPICMAAQDTPWQKLNAQQAGSAAGGIQSHCLGRLGLPFRRPGFPPEIMNRLCKPTLGGTQTPQLTNERAMNDDSGTFITFDVPGSTGTSPSAITANGVVIGNYGDASGLTHGFLRTPSGAFTTFDVPGAQLTAPTDINPGGVITGWYCPTVDCQISGTITIGGFLRDSDGTFTTFDAPAGAYILGSIYKVSGSPPSINPRGDIVGTYVAPGFVEHGFLRTKDGAFTTIDPPGAGFTEVIAINPAGGDRGGLL